MEAKELAAILERVESWPEAAQRQLAEIALEIEQDLSGEYHPTLEVACGHRTRACGCAGWPLRHGMNRLKRPWRDFWQR